MVTYAKFDSALGTILNSSKFYQKYMILMKPWEWEQHNKGV